MVEEQCLYQTTRRNVCAHFIGQYWTHIAHTNCPDEDGDSQTLW